jgi:uncharacterized protein
VNLTHPLVEFRPSTIHGLGGFATTLIPAGSRVIEYVGERITKEQSLERCAGDNAFIFCLDETWDLDGSVDWNPARLMNHCCEPNCDAENIEGRIWIVARRAIQPGEEITYNYNYDLEDYREHPCRCGSPQCVGYIVAEELFESLRSQLSMPAKL